MLNFRKVYDIKIMIDSEVTAQLYRILGDIVGMETLYPNDTVTFCLTPGATMRLKALESTIPELKFERDPYSGYCGTLFNYPIHCSLYETSKEYHSMSDYSFCFQFEGK